MKFIMPAFLVILSSVLNAADSIEVKNPWVNQMPPSTMSNAGYMEITNNSSDLLILHKVISPQFEMSSIHQTKSEQGLMKMIPVVGIEIPPNGTVVLEPGGLHIMLMNRAENLNPGDEVEINLTFSNGQKVTIKAPVQ